MALEPAARSGDYRRSDTRPIAMTYLANTALTAVVLLAGLNLIWSVFKARQSTLNTIWALFCGSLGLAMLDRLAGDSLGVLRPFILVAAGGTCGIFWLVARSLFRPGKAVGALHWLLVAAIIAPSAIAQVLASMPFDADLRSTLTGGLRNFQLLFGSTAMVLSAWEGVNGWQAGLSQRERTLRIAYVATISGCVLLSQAFSPPPDASQMLLDLKTLIPALCALCVLLVSGFVVADRNRPPMLDAADSATDSRKKATTEEHALAQRIEMAVRMRSLYLQPELKVATLAQALAIPDYRVSRAICRALGYSNFNQYINRYRIEHAQKLLTEEPERSVLAIGIDSGFGSIGPFNRTFKAVTGMTPRQYRASLSQSAEATVTA